MREESRELMALARSYRTQAEAAPQYVTVKPPPPPPRRRKAKEWERVVRDIGYELTQAGNSFTVADVTAAGVPYSAALEWLGKWCERETFRRQRSWGAAYVYERVEHTGGPASRPKTEPVELTVVRRERAQLVSGTGRGLRTGNQRSQEIVDAAVKQGATVRFDGRNHIILEKDGKKARIAMTPGGSGNAARNKARGTGVRL